MNAREASAAIKRAWEGNLPGGITFMEIDGQMFHLVPHRSGAPGYGALYAAYLLACGPDGKSFFYKALVLPVSDLTNPELMFNKVARAVLEFDGELRAGTAKPIKDGEKFELPEEYRDQT